MDFANRKPSSWRALAASPWALAALLLLCTVACRKPEEGGERRVRDPDAGFEPGDNEQPGCEELACEAPARCESNSTGPRCVCPKGFAAAADNPRACSDIDECMLATHDCNANANCTNTAGGFSCACKDGFDGDGRQCRARSNCEDATNTCHPDALCTRAGAEVRCECNEGFTGDGRLCDDIDECEQNGSLCVDHAHCTNLRGDYACACDAGFLGDATQENCIDACEFAQRDAARCDPNGHGRCKLAPDGTASCTSCTPDSVGDGVRCTVSSACSALGCGANTVCTSDANPSCACAPGFSGDPMTGCTDIDECADSTRCDDKTQCVNKPGGYICDCLHGLERVNGECVNIDECERGLDLCDPNATCTDLPVGYKCECKPGFEGDGIACADIDECAQKLDDCLNDGTARCQNTRGGYECVCPPGFAGDAKKEACYCDLSGYWGMRQSVTLVLPERAAGGTVIIEETTTRATVWELHRYVYEGDTIRVERQQCGADKRNEIFSPLYTETYSSFVPNEIFDKTEFQRTVDIPLPRSAALPGSPFDTPRDALVQGLRMSDPVNDPWPKSFEDIPMSAWVDSDKDGEPGITLWPAKTSEKPTSGRDTFSYLPIALQGDSTRIASRTGCVSTAVRSISRLDGTLQSCGRIAGDLITEKTEGRVFSCTVLRMSDWDATDVECKPSDWSDARRCNNEQIHFLDDQDQTTIATATFESVKLGDLNAKDIHCAKVRESLPPL